MQLYPDTVTHLLFVIFCFADPLVSSSVIYQAGETANLPCDISVPNGKSPTGKKSKSSSSQKDELVLIMWYREDVKTPIYSIGKLKQSFMKIGQRAKERSSYKQA